MSRPRIAVVGLGGTIASTSSARAAGIVPTLSAAELVDAVPELRDIATVHAESLLAKPSPHLDFTDLVKLRDRLAELVVDGYEGLVVMQGTDTLEESSFAIDLTWSSPVPVAFTGAMRHPSAAGADGPANVLAAVRTVASPSSRSIGVVLVMNDEIHFARKVKKTHTFKTSAFSSKPDGPAGTIWEGSVHLGALSRPAPLSAPSEWDERIEILVAALGGSPRLLEAIERSDPSGIVIAGFGGGHVREEFVPVLRRLNEKVPVVLSSRVGFGPVLESTYGFVGSEIDLLGNGLLSSGSLNPIKARILLSLAVSLGGSREEIEARFSSYVAQHRLTA